MSSDNPGGLVSIGGPPVAAPNLVPRAPAPPGAEDCPYVCPMCPGVRQLGPGVCPKCGMALEPEVASRGDDKNPELDVMQRRFRLSVPLTAAVVALAMTMQHLPWLELALSTPVVLWGGYPFFVRAWKSILNRRLNMFTLVAMGTGTAYVYSVIATFLGRHEVYFEAAAAITTLVLLGQVLELRARAKTGGAIRALLGLTPQTVTVIDDASHERALPLDRVHPGLRLRVRPGERIPVDGV
ncbi:MAG TPA: heavy metal-binding domain-containing protein, partial [Bryobacteraceae bacterium]|nr:heavy metal-binding domain-containing protein [Bryobacteraceae bacterium]